VVEEQVKSLGARFVKIDLGETGQTKDGYAKALTDEQLQKQREGMAKVCAAADVVITTAQLFGRKAPLIVTEEMVAGMSKGSVLVDLAVETGGNVAGSQANQEVELASSAWPTCREKWQSTPARCFHPTCLPLSPNSGMKKKNVLSWTLKMKL
jgi:NAD(P) transhydrogenase subunit alpha